MMPPGHLGVGILLALPAVAAGVPRARVAVLLPALAGTLAPDLVDKGARALHVVDASRWIGHSAPLWLALALIGRSLRRRTRAPWWLAVGGLSHLYLDAVEGVLTGATAHGVVLSSWFAWPFARDDAFFVRLAAPVLDLPPLVHVVEAALVLGALGALVARVRSGTPPPGTSR